MTDLTFGALEDLVGLHVIQFVGETWVADEPGGHRQFAMDAEAEAEADDIDDKPDDTRVLLVRVDGEMHALFGRGSKDSLTMGGLCTDMRSRTVGCTKIAGACTIISR
jgi:hypothetical protein